MSRTYHSHEMSSGKRYSHKVSAHHNDEDSRYYHESEMDSYNYDEAAVLQKLQKPNCLERLTRLIADKLGL